ncbi:MAG: protein kinase [Acidobacteriota bacterium]|nr:protein kinase [Acidobacteriota bacterium]
MALTPQTRLGRYEIRSLLGVGGMGEVYLASDHSLRRLVAVKLLPAEFTQNKTNLRRFELEAYAASSLNHPNILTIHEIGEQDGHHFIATEYVEGQSLRQRIAGADMELREILDIGQQIASALATAHEAGIVHRDIKPENVMLRRDGLVKVLDFGLAKLIDEAGAAAKRAESGDEAPTQALAINTEPGRIMGTVNYMSPEQARGLEVDARTDIWSLGVVLYEIAAGRQPFVGASPIDLITTILQREPPSLLLFRSDLPVEVARIVEKALVKEREERYQTAKDLSLDLKRLRQRLDVEAELERSVPPEEAKAHATHSRDEDQTLSSDSSSGSFQTAPLHNLSQGSSPLVGREQEIEKIKGLLRQDDVRLVTLTGIGGTGKTRLAKEIARRLLEVFPGGVFFIELAAIHDPALVISSIAQPLDVTEAGGQSLLDALKSYLRDKRMLLVVDNFEQVTPAAPLLAELLAASPHLKMLVTSRAVLHLSVEQEVIVPPLTVPDATTPLSADELLKFEAIRLFVERARTVKPNFTLTDENVRSVAEICLRLEGLPLAIELAAARVKVLQPAAILARLEKRLKLLTGGARDLPARQQTMRGAVEWSYDLLDESEKMLFRRLAVFMGGTTIEAAESVCSGQGVRPDTVSEIEVLDGISSLVDKSLLVHKERANGESRFRMLEVVREYALEHLEASGELEAVARAHAAFFLALAERAEPELRGARQMEWLERLDHEHDNLRAALQWSIEHQPETALRLAGALQRFWCTHDHYTEGARWLAAALQKNSGSPSLARAKALEGAGFLAWQVGDYSSARQFYEESLAESRATGDKMQVALSSRGLGIVLMIQGDIAAARTLYAECLAISQEAEDKFLIAASLNDLGEAARMQEDYATARPLYEEAVALSRQLGNQERLGTILANLGATAYQVGDYETAGACYREALALARELGYKSSMAISLDGLAALATKHGQPERAANLAGAADVLRESISRELVPVDRLFRDAYLIELRAALSEEAFAAACKQGRKLKLDKAIRLALEAV